MSGDGVCSPVSPPDTLTGPCPVRKTVITDPAAAGFESELTLLSWFSAAAEPAAAPGKIPGAAAKIAIVTLELDAEFVVTFSVAAPGWVSNGTWKLIWVELTNSRGQAVPFSVTVTPPRVVGRGKLSACSVLAANPDP